MPTNYLLLAILIAWQPVGSQAPTPQKSSQKPVRVVSSGHPPLAYKETELKQKFFASDFVVFGTVASIRPADRTLGSPGRAQSHTGTKKSVHDQQFAGHSGAIASQLATTKGDIYLDADMPPLIGPGTDTPEALVTMLTCNSNAVLVGIPTLVRSEETAIGSTVYSTWNVVAEDVLKIPRVKRIPWRSRVEVLTHNGSVTVGGRRVTIRNPLFDGIKQGHRYLFFLRLVEQTGAFVARFALDMNGEQPLRPDGDRFDRGTSTLDFVARMREHVIPADLTSDNCRKE